MKKIAVLTVLWVCSISYSQCYEERYKEIANIVAVDVVNKSWDGGANITTLVKDCSYDDTKGVLWTDVTIEFYGQLSGKYYRAEGYLTINRYSSRYSFSPYYKNQNLKDYENMIGVIVTAATIYELSKD